MIRLITTKMVPVLMICIYATVSLAEDGPKTVAVMDFDVSSSQYASFGRKVSKTIREMLEDSESYEVISEKDLKKQAKNLGFEMTYSDADSAAAALGEKLGVDYMVMGFAVKLGRKYKITARVLQVSTAQSAVVKGDDLEDNKKYLKPFAETITTELGGFARSQADKSYQIGLQYLQSGDYTNALQNFGQATAIDPTFGAAWVGQVACYYGMEDYEKAMIYADKTLEIDPSVGQAYYYKAALLQRDGQCEEAIPYFEKAVEADSTYHPAYYNWAMCLRDLFEIEKAVEKMEEAIALNDDPAYRASLARIFEDQMDFGRAFKVYYDVVQEDSTQTYAWRRIITSGSEYIQFGNFDNGGADEYGFTRVQITGIVHQAINLVIEEEGLIAAPIYRYLGDALYTIGSYNEALEIYQEWERIDPENLEVVALMVKILKELGREQEALNRLSDLVQRDPENVNALVALSVAYMDLGRLSQAQANIRDAMRKAPEEPLPIMIAGEIKERWAETKEAEAKRIINDKENYPDFVAREQACENTFNESIELAKEALTYMQRALPLFQQKGDEDRAGYVEKKIRILQAEPERLAATRDATIYAGG